MDKKKPKLLLIHNEGTLAEKSNKNLGKYFSLEKFLVQKNISLDIMIPLISEIIQNNELKLLVYISGETRVKKNMIKFNFELPAQIIELCDRKSIPFVYLSSLSVYGIPRSNLVYANSKKNPFNEYGRTKLMFDDLISNKFVNLKYCSIAPGTIINPNSSKNNIIKNGLKHFSNKPLIWFLKIICPAGNYSCVHIDDLVKCLVKECIELYNADKDMVYKQYKNCSSKVKIFDLVSYVLGHRPIFKLSPIPIKFINIIALFFSKKFRMILLVYLADIEYINEYDCLKKQPLSKYLDQKF